MSPSRTSRFSSGLSPAACSGSCKLASSTCVSLTSTSSHGVDRLVPSQAGAERGRGSAPLLGLSRSLGGRPLATRTVGSLARPRRGAPGSGGGVGRVGQLFLVVEGRALGHPHRTLPRPRRQGLAQLPHHLHRLRRRRVVPH